MYGPNDGSSKVGCVRHDTIMIIGKMNFSEISSPNLNFPLSKKQMIATTNLQDRKNPYVLYCLAVSTYNLRSISPDKLETAYRGRTISSDNTVEPCKNGTTTRDRL